MDRLTKIFAIVAVLVLSIGTAQADVVYSAELVADQVVPPSGAAAYGQATMIVNDVDNVMHLTLNFTGFDSAQTAAELLFGAEGEAGTLAAELPLGSPLAVTLDYSQDIVDALEADGLSIQISTEAFPGGAIRGTFMFVTVGTEASSWTGVKSLFE
jgi:hypothetical protein